MDETGDRIPDFEPRSAPENGISPTVAGTVLLAAGTLLVAFAVGRLGDVRAEIPTWVLATTGGLLVVGGILLVGHACAGLLRRMRARKLRGLAPNQPWVADYDWDPAGASSSPIGRSFRELLFGMLMGVFLLPFNWVTFCSEAPLFFRIPFGGVTMIFDAFALWILAIGLRRAAASVRYGATSVRFHRFPYFTGETLDLHLAMPRGAQGGVIAELRCVQERIESTEESTKVIGYRLFAESTRVPGASVGTGRTPSGSAVRFLIPADAPGTALSARPARYWELVVRPAETASLYAARLLVPIYRRSSR